MIEDTLTQGAIRRPKDKTIQRLGKDCAEMDGSGHRKAFLPTEIFDQNRSSCCAYGFVQPVPAPLIDCGERNPQRVFDHIRPHGQVVR